MTLVAGDLGTPELLIILVIALMLVLGLVVVVLLAVAARRGLGRRSDAVPPGAADGQDDQHA